MKKIDVKRGAVISIALFLLISCGYDKDKGGGYSESIDNTSGDVRGKNYTEEKKADAKKSSLDGKIALTNLFAAEIVLDLGAEAVTRIGAVPALVDDPEFSVIAGQWPGSVQRIRESVESIVYLQPSLVIVAAFHSENLTHLLEESGIPFVVLQPLTGFDAYINNVTLIAESLGQPKNGEILTARFQSRLSFIRQRSKNIQKPLAVLSYMAGSIAGGETCFQDISSAAGLRNLAAEKGVSGHRHIEMEQLLVWNPDAIVISCGDSCEKSVRLFYGLPGAEALEAVQQNRVIAIPGPVFTSSGENMLLFAEMLQKKIYGME